MQKTESPKEHPEKISGTGVTEYRPKCVYLIFQTVGTILECFQGLAVSDHFEQELTRAFLGLSDWWYVLNSIVCPQFQTNYDTYFWPFTSEYFEWSNTSSTDFNQTVRYKYAYIQLSQISDPSCV